MAGCGIGLVSERLLRNAGKEAADAKNHTRLSGRHSIAHRSDTFGPHHGNLLLNSLEAGGEGTSVRIDAFKDEDQGQAIIKVMDDGPGIARHLLPEALFEPYKTTKSGGSGVGLWQVKRLITSLHGSISAEISEDRGACFLLKLPRQVIEEIPEGKDNPR